VTIERDAATVTPDHVGGDSQPEPCAATMAGARPIAAVEAVENAFLIL